MDTAVMLPHVRTLSELASAVAARRDPYAAAFAGAHRAATSDWNGTPKPSGAQARAGNYALGTVVWNSLTLRIENPAHSVREGVGDDGRPWRNLLMAHYGYIAGTKGADGDGIDVFLGPAPESRKVWVLNQTNANGQFDEHKVLLGFHEERAAVDSYRLSYSPGWDRFRSPPVRLSLEQLGWWLKWADTTKELSLDLLPPEADDMNEATAPDLTRVFWDSAAMPLCGLTLMDVLYSIRRSDGDHGLLLDPITMAELTEGFETSRLDAMVVMAGRLQPRIEALMRVMDAAGVALKPIAVQISDPIKRYGGVHVAALFELSDGQTITAWFHNPDSSPGKLTPADTLVSWRWLLNKKDITIVVAPESGQDLDIRDIARRVMRLAEKNSAAFARVNAKRAETMAEVQALKQRLSQRQQVLAGIQKRLAEVAEVRATAVAAAPVEVEGAELGDFPATEEGARALRNAADQAYRELPHMVPCPALGGDVQLRSTGRRKVLSLSADTRKLLLIPALPRIIGRAKKLRTRPPYNGDQDKSAVAYHTLRTEVTLLGELIAVRLVIKEDLKGQFHYDHTVHEAEAVFDAVGTKENGTQSVPFPAATSDDGGADRSRLASGQLDRIVLDKVDAVKGRMIVNLFIEGEAPDAADDAKGGAPSLANASQAANAVLSVAAEVDGPNAYRTVIAVNEHAELLGLTVSWAAVEALPAAVPKMDDARTAARLDRTDGGSIEVNIFEPGDKVVDTDSGKDLVVVNQVGYKVFCRGTSATWVHANRLKHTSGRKAVRVMLDAAAQGAYLGQERKAIAATASLLRWFREFIRSDKDFARNPMEGKFGFSLPTGGSVMNKDQAQKLLTKLVDIAVNRKGGVEDMSAADRQRLQDFAHDARVIGEYFDQRMHRGEGNRNQLRTPQMKKRYPEIDNPGKFDQYAVRRSGQHQAFDSALFPEEGAAGYVVGQVKAADHDLVQIFVRGDGLASVVPQIEVGSLAEATSEAGWTDQWKGLLEDAQDQAAQAWSDFDPTALGGDQREKAVDVAVQQIGRATQGLRAVVERTDPQALREGAQLSAARAELDARMGVAQDEFNQAKRRLERLGVEVSYGTTNPKMADYFAAQAEADAMRKALDDQEVVLRKASGAAALAALPEDATIAQRVAARMKQAGIDSTGDWLVAAIESRDAEKLRSVLGNLDNRASRAAFADVTGVKLGATKAQTYTQIDEWLGVTPEQRTEIEATKKAKQASDATLASLRRAWEDMASLNVRADGRSTSLQKVIVNEAASGATEIRTIAKGAATQYGIAPAGGPAKIIKFKPFNAFLKAALPFGDLRKALDALGVSIPAAPETPTDDGNALGLRARGADALAEIKGYMSVGQRKVIAQAMRGEEGNFFAEKMIELRERISAMPVTYEQEGQGDQAIAYLHYFRGGADWYITEKDKGGDVSQAFGHADLFGDGGELGYIDISELTEGQVELDLHWTPKSLANSIRSGQEGTLPAPTEVPKAVPVSVETVTLLATNAGLNVDIQATTPGGAVEYAMVSGQGQKAGLSWETREGLYRLQQSAGGFDQSGESVGPLLTAFAATLPPTRDSTDALPDGQTLSAAIQEPVTLPDPDAAPPRVVGAQAVRADALSTLEQIASGSHPDMLEPELADRIERVMMAFPDDAAVQELALRAITAYSEGLLKATT